jgi:hypothetical protein
MLINEGTGRFATHCLIIDGIDSCRSRLPAISTSGVLLVPYEKSHVTTYHDWMKDEVNILDITSKGRNLTVLELLGDSGCYGFRASLARPGVCHATELEGRP